jgi:hypothetical protein
VGVGTGGGVAVRMQAPFAQLGDLRGKWAMKEGAADYVLDAGEEKEIRLAASNECRRDACTTTIQTTIPSDPLPKSFARAGTPPSAVH